ncbi:MAG: histidine phosphatase family protein [Colwellia sp.]
MKKFSLLLVSLLISFSGFTTDNNADITVGTADSNATQYSLYLVRHAEKQADAKNPSLTHCGQKRAEQLATLLSQTTIANVYSTSYKRTMATAKPSAKRHNLAIKNYNPRHLAQLAQQLKQRKENSLIVGHSNTTPQLAALLSGEKIAPLSEHDYQQLYQIQFMNDQPILTRLKQPLVCKQ